MPEASVFPGGGLDQADLSPDWLKLFEHCGIPKSQLQELSKVDGARPFIFQSLPQFDKNQEETGYDPNVHLPLEIAFKICAIRETFEESGVLLAKSRNFIQNPTSGTKSALTISNLNKNIIEWKSLVQTNASCFLTMCLENDICPDIWALHEWSDWLTPTCFPKRFDTIFYVSCVEHIPDVSLDQSEITGRKWCTPFEALSLHWEEKIWLPPPQFYELFRMSQVNSFDKLSHFALGRSGKGVDSWLPVRIKTRDGSLLHLLPGDDLYPKDPDYLGQEDGFVRKVDKTRKELNETSTNIHRCDMAGSHDWRFYCNIELPYGQLTALELAQFEPHKSNL